VIGVFHQACNDIGELAARANADPMALADQVFDALDANDYGQFDNLIRVLSPALGQTGLEHLKQHMVELATSPVKRPADEDRAPIGWSSSGPLFEDELAERSRASRTRLALMEIADALGDVDGFIAQYDDRARKVPKIAAEIAQRLLAAGRAEEAWQVIEGTDHDRARTSWHWPDFSWEDARIEVLEALGRSEQAQSARWSCFERSLSSSHLRAYLKRLPDFEDIEAERKALDYAERSPNLLQALCFLVAWRALDRAANLIVERSGELDGNHYEVLTSSAGLTRGSMRWPGQARP
jgi:hypothetical protein